MGWLRMGRMVCIDCEIGCRYFCDFVLVAAFLSSMKPLIVAL